MLYQCWFNLNNHWWLHESVRGKRFVSCRDLTHLYEGNSPYISHCTSDGLVLGFYCTFSSCRDGRDEEIHWFSSYTHSLSWKHSYCFFFFSHFIVAATLQKNYYIHFPLSSAHNMPVKMLIACFWCYQIIGERNKKQNTSNIIVTNHRNNHSLFSITGKLLQPLVMLNKMVLVWSLAHPFFSCFFLSAPENVSSMSGWWCQKTGFLRLLQSPGWATFKWETVSIERLLPPYSHNSSK